MNWLLFYLLIATGLLLFVWILIRERPWILKLLQLTALVIPAAIYTWPYFVIKHEHKRLCEAEGGLKIFIQPEKTDRVRYVGDRLSDQGNLDAAMERFPKVQRVEMMTQARGAKGERLTYFDAYIASPNPRAGQPMKEHPWKERPYVLTIVRVDNPDPDVFEISQVDTFGKHSRRTDTLLTKNGKLYARHTEFLHSWDGIQYPDATPHWRCPDINALIPPKNNPNATPDAWVRRKSALSQMDDLIF